MSDQASTSSQSNPGVRHMPHSGPLPAGLVLVSTPIGNLADLTPRAAACLAQADLVLCEDTRVTGKLLAAWSISSRTEALHEHNERQRIPALLDLLERGQRIALVSDAGTPLISDPGFRLVRAAIAKGLPVSAAPGANAAIMALTLSGLPPHPFLFIGFAPPRSAARRASFAALRAAEQSGLRATLVWYEAPHRLTDMLADLNGVFGGNRDGAVARELTKRFEEVRHGKLPQLHAYFEQNLPRGEITVMLGPDDVEQTNESDLDRQLIEAMKHHSLKDAAAFVAETANLPRRTIYARALQLSAQEKSASES